MAVVAASALIVCSAVLGLAATLGMSALTIAISVAAVTGLGLGAFGMGLATSVPSVVAVALCCGHFIFGASSVRLVNPLNHLRVLPSVLATGAPDSITYLCITARTLILNQLLLAVAGSAAVSALSVHSSVGLFLTALTIGVAETGVLLLSMFFGEEDASALRLTVRAALRIGVPVSCVLSLICLMFAPQLVGLFGLTGPAADFAVAAVRAYCFYVPLDLVLTVFVNFYQSVDSLGVAYALTTAQCFVLPVASAAVGSAAFGADGVWWAFPASVALCTVLLYAWADSLRRRRGEQVEGALDTMLVMPRGFQEDWTACATFGCTGEVASGVTVSEELAAWCREHGVDRRRVYQVALAVEEMAGNVLRHGPVRPTERVEVEVKIIAKRDGSLVLRLRDNGKPFNPLDFDLEGQDRFACIGIRMIRAIVGHMEYQNAVGLINLVFTLPASTPDGFWARRCRRTKNGTATKAVPCGESMGAPPSACRRRWGPWAPPRPRGTSSARRRRWG